jgi:hypothetical protein
MRDYHGGMNSPALLLADMAPVVGDVVFAGVSVAFFALAIVFAWFCKKVR